MPIRSYRETIALVSELPKEDNEKLLEDVQGQDMQQNIAVETDSAAKVLLQTNELPNSTSVGNRRDIFSLDEGDVVLQWPEKMSAESFEDFQSWVELQLRKIKRTIN